MMKIQKRGLAFFAVLFVMLASLSAGAFAFEGEILASSALKKGDKVCLLAPSRTDSYFENSMKRIPLVVEKLSNRGFQVVVFEESFQSSELGIGDGTEQIRSDAFNKAINDPEIKAILAYHGGYGTMHLLDKIDFEKFRENKPIFVGFSDHTALHIPLVQKARVITFYGPVMAMEGFKLGLGQIDTFDVLFDMLMNPKQITELHNTDDNSEFKVFKEGVCEGQLTGGNLTLIGSLMGTPYEINLKDKILFFESCEEELDEFHQRLWQLKLSGKLNEVKGIIIGALTNEMGKIPTTEDKENEKTFLKAAFDVLKDLNVPIVYNVHAGHLNNPITVPIGAKAKIENNRIFITEPVVEQTDIQKE